MSRRSGWPLVAAGLTLALVVAGAGWWWSARSGLEAPGCHELSADGQTIRMTFTQGAATERAEYSVVETDDRVVLAYDEDRHSGISTMEAYPTSVEVRLRIPLGDRSVVGPDGDAVPRCAD